MMEQTGGKKGGPIATDLDFIVRLGYPAEDARKALQITNGDRSAACYLLAKGSLNDASTSSWRQEMADDWIDGVGKHSLPRDAEGRALQKSPVYIRLASYRGLSDEDVQYETKVTLKDGRQWTLLKTYSEYATMWQSLPLGTCMKFKNGFPMLSVFQFFSNDRSTEFLDNRMDKLNEWVRELTLNETCMSSARVLKVLYDFIEADKYGGVVSIESAISRQTAALRQRSAQKNSGDIKSGDGSEVNGAMVKNSPLVGHTDSFRNYDASRVLYGSKYPVIDTRILPLPIDRITSYLPCRMNLKLLPTYQETVQQRTATATATATAQPNSEPVNSRRSSAAFPSNEQAKIDSNAIKVEDVIAGMELDMASSFRAASESSLDECDAVDEKAQSGEPSESPPAVAAVPPPLPPEPAPLLPPDSTTALAPGTCAVKESSPPPAAVEVSKSASVHEKSGSSRRVIECPITIDARQLEKDYKRDRIVIQGRKLAGSHCSIDELTGVSVGILQQMLKDAKKDLLVPTTSYHPHVGGAQAGADEESFLRMLSKCIMQAVSRTESAYFSHACLYDILDVANSRNLPDFRPFLFVPEAVLADAVEVRFRIQEKPLAPTAKASAVDGVAADTTSSMSVAPPTSANKSVTQASPLLETDTLSSIQRRRASARGTGVLPGSPEKNLKVGAGFTCGTVARPPAVTASMRPTAEAVGAGKSTGVSPLLSYAANGSTFMSRRAHTVSATATVAAPVNKAKGFPASTAAAASAPSSREWCICCEGEASTVYRLMDSETMKPLLQLRVTYTCTLYGFPPSSTNPGAGATRAFRIKEGKSYLVIEQVTTSTARDWGPSR